MPRRPEEAAITCLSLIVGELVPKRLALGNAEGIAAFVAPFLAGLARVGARLVWLMRVSTEAILALLRVKGEPGSTVTEEEVKSLIAEGTSAGVFAPAETDMIDRVLRLADRSVRSIMVLRPEVFWLDADDPAAAILDEIRDSGHSRFPVARGDVDDTIGCHGMADRGDNETLAGFALHRLAISPARASTSCGRAGASRSSTSTAGASTR